MQPTDKFREQTVIITNKQTNYENNEIFNLRNIRIIFRTSH